jgi:hypothetical protein
LFLFSASFSELEGPVIKFILSRPAMTFTRSDVYRSEALLENINTSKVMYLTGLQANKILGEGDKVRNVHLGSCIKLSRADANQKARKMKAEAVKPRHKE